MEPVLQWKMVAVLLMLAVVDSVGVGVSVKVAEAHWVALRDTVTLVLEPLTASAEGERETLEEWEGLVVPVAPAPPAALRMEAVAALMPLWLEVSLLDTVEVGQRET